MLVLISPAKVQNIKQKSTIQTFTQPIFLKEAKQIVEQLRSYSVSELADLLQVNSKIATQNANRFMDWQPPFTPDNAKQAATLYDGEVFRGLDFASFTEEQMLYAQEHFRILSGLYGILRPLDLIQPYRVEVSSKIPTSKGNTMYDYWSDSVTKEVNKLLKKSGNPPVLINLMSGEYFKTLQTDKIDARIIDFEFLQYQPDTDKFKSIVIYIKKARGMMTRFILQNQITNPEELKGFAEEGYWYDEERSCENKMVFIR